MMTSIWNDPNFRMFLFNIIVLIFAYWVGSKSVPVLPRPVRFLFLFEGKEIKQMDLKDNYQLPLSLQAVDKFGNPTNATLDAAPTWTLVDGTLGSLGVADDGMSAVFTPSGALGATQIQVLGLIGGAQVAGSFDLVVISGDAAQLILVPGAPAIFAVKKKA